MTASNMAITARNVVKTYGDVTALGGVDLVAPEGRVLGLLGPNGAGKTTLVRILTTLLMPDSGEVTVNGINVLEKPDQVRNIIGLAGQYTAVDEQLTGRENLVMVGQLYHFSRREARARAKQLLAEFSLEDAADRPVKTYSGGMRRRLDLAASIVARPEILFLDEPTTGLDPRTRMDLWDVIRGLVKEGTTLLLTTQYLEEADVLADRIVLIDNGIVAAEGTADELKAQMGHDVIELRIENQDNLTLATSSLASLGGDQVQVDQGTGQITLPAPEGAQSLVEVVRILDREQVRVADISLRRPSLDDVFLTLTAKNEDELVSV